MTNPENVRHVAALARAVALLRRSPEPDKPQKDALRALVAVAAERSATLRWYADTLTLDGVVVPTDDPRLAAFAERLAAQHVAEITIAMGAGPDELLALTLGLAADPGHGRIKERLRDAGSSRVMVVLHQYGEPKPRSVTAAFEKVKADQSVLDQWNKFLEQGARAEAERVADSRPAPAEAAGSAAPPEAIGSPAHPRAPSVAWQYVPPAAAEPLPPAEEPPPMGPGQRQPRPSALQEAGTPESWFAAFERSVKNKFPDHFGDVDWGYRIDRAAGTVSAGDSQGRTSLSVSLPQDYLEQSSWLLAGQLLEKLRTLAEKEGAIRKRR